MIGALMKSSSRFAILATAGLFVGGLSLTPAQAADLGGDCCADLEERVAELEATTVRKGNRKVSVTLSGQVNEALMYWNDGIDSDAYLINNVNSGSRFRFKGSAKFKPGWSAGFYFEFQRGGPNGANVTQLDDDGGSGNGDSSLVVRQSNWYIKSDKYGQIRVGQASPATDDLGLIDLGGVGVIGSGDNLLGNGIRFRAADGRPVTIPGDTAWGSVFTRLDTTARSNIIRYDTPTIGGLVFSAAWGEDDIWDVAVRYKGEFNGLRFAAGIGYIDITDEIASGEADSRIIGSASVWHMPSGIFASLGINSLDDGSAADNDSFGWNLRFGYRGRLNALGQTSIYGEFGQLDLDNDLTVTIVDGVDVTGTTSGSNTYGFGIVQRIDAAAMELYVGWRLVDADITPDDPAFQIEDTLNVVTMGARIKF